VIALAEFPILGTVTELLLTTKDVAEMLQVDKSTVKRWTDNGKQVCFWKMRAQGVSREDLCQ
jgi:excisionase family DNA binding protein